MSDRTSMSAIAYFDREPSPTNAIALATLVRATTARTGTSATRSGTASVLGCKSTSAEDRRISSDSCAKPCPMLSRSSCGKTPSTNGLAKCFVGDTARTSHSQLSVMRTASSYSPKWTSSRSSILSRHARQPTLSARRASCARSSWNQSAKLRPDPKTSERSCRGRTACLERFDGRDHQDTRERSRHGRKGFRLCRKSSVLRC
jgi:hypothetical protein